MNRILLYGGLADKFGESFELDVRNPGEAFRALNCQLPDFARMCVDGDYTLVRELPDGTFAMTEEMLFIGMQNSTLHFLPNVEGNSNKGAGKIVLGVGLIVGTLFLPGVGAAIMAGHLAAIGTLATMGLSMGLALALGGAALLLSPTPKIGKESEQTNSFVFSGDVSTAGQGFAVPVTYGYDRVKGIPVATQITTNEYRVDTASKLDNPPPVGGYGGIGGMIRSAYV